MKDHRTLFAIDLSEQRARKRLEAPSKVRTARGAGATSDVRRHRPMLIAAVTGMLGLLVGWRVAPATTTSRGALALPHEAAELKCTACHEEANPSKPAKADACAGCHGAHPSRRAAHRGLVAEGKLGCVTCHDVHGTDQGVRFIAPDGIAVRYGVGAKQEQTEARFPSARDVTVPLVPLHVCTGACHDTTSSTDPIVRCISPEGSLNMCFDEHQAWSAVAPVRPGGACASQHDNDRFAAWDAAREVATIAPNPPRASRPVPARWWLVWGAGAVTLGALGYAGSVFARRRLRARPSGAAGAEKPADRVRLPQIDTNTCLGCYACVDVCPYDVFTVERYVAKVERPEVCCGLTLCEQVCPNGSLVITDGEPIGNRPQLDDDLQARSAPGVYLAGDVTGLPLIKNAIRQGSAAVKRIADTLPKKHDGDLDLVIVGAGPAGISAALEAKQLGLRYTIIEQGTVAQSIKSFPRGKLVFDQPLELPVTGKLWLAEATKEELLAKWTRVIREERIAVREGMRFETLVRERDVIVVRARELATEEQHDLRAARVLLAIGMRGSPRKLPVALSSAVESKVFYHLADAREFSGQRVMVVGLGDVAMECAVALAHQPDCTVTLVHRGAGFTRGKKRNIDEVKRLVDAGRIELMLKSEIFGVEQDHVVVATGDAHTRVENDAVFVMIGSHAPSALLEKAGVALAPPPPQ